MRQTGQPQDIAAAAAFLASETAHYIYIACVVLDVDGRHLHRLPDPVTTWLTKLSSTDGVCAANAAGDSNNTRPSLGVAD